MGWPGCSSGRRAHCPPRDARVLPVLHPGERQQLSRREGLCPRRRAPENDDVETNFAGEEEQSAWSAFETWKTGRGPVRFALRCVSLILWSQEKKIQLILVATS
uniref:Uncharacterized protein n=1 Tax=Arundo donax TaxID=35708 RepID=A0A0A9ALQ3_ARUDO